MDDQKIDAGLSAKLDLDVADADKLPVFVRTAEGLSESACEHLLKLGINAGGGNTVFAADLSTEQVRGLAEQPWVTSIRLARQARPVALR